MAKRTTTIPNGPYEDNDSLSSLRSYEQLVNSPRRELKIFTAREGGVEHVGADNMTFGRDYIADWFASTLGGAANGRYPGAPL